jgi:hypothetical protein
MTQTRIWPGARALAAGDRTPAIHDSGDHRAVLRLWTLLHAQALLQGTIAGRDNAAFIEDDRRRLAASQMYQ